MQDTRERVAFATGYALFVFFLLLVFCALLWVPAMGGTFFNPAVWVTLFGPAIPPSLVNAVLMAASARFTTWRSVIWVTVAVFALEHAIFWTWRSTINDELGFSLFWLLPIMLGLPLALIAFGILGAWKRP